MLGLDKECGNREDIASGAVPTKDAAAFLAISRDAQRLSVCRAWWRAFSHSTLLISVYPADQAEACPDALPASLPSFLQNASYLAKERDLGVDL